MNSEGLFPRFVWKLLLNFYDHQRKIVAGLRKFDKSSKKANNLGIKRRKDFIQFVFNS